MGQKKQILALLDKSYSKANLVNSYENICEEYEKKLLNQNALILKMQQKSPIIDIEVVENGKNDESIKSILNDIYSKAIEMSLSDEFNIIEIGLQKEKQNSLTL